ncbi:hypothetical protein BASA83_010300 [Batrachochytrium salamandrivorans]|nr:hypothetical protein BASA83_010300 [Batrachochytrium salamandrivorans]
MMNMEDGNRLENCDRDNSARGMGVRGTEVYSCFCSLSLRKLLLPGTLRLGPLSHVDTFFVDCGADDLFMDSKLAADLQIPLLKLSTPITLRLADGDSSSSLTHRTVSHSKLHIGKHVETDTFIPIDCSLTDSISLGSMQADVYPLCLKVSPISDVSVSLRHILSSFFFVVSEDQAENTSAASGTLTCSDRFKACTSSEPCPLARSSTTLTCDRWPTPSFASRTGDEVQDFFHQQDNGQFGFWSWPFGIAKLPPAANFPRL